MARVDENEAVAAPVRYAVFMTAFHVGFLRVLALEIAERVHPNADVALRILAECRRRGLYQN